jgi:hypothetical protein
VWSWKEKKSQKIRKEITIDIRGSSPGLQAFKESVYGLFVHQKKGIT